MQDEDTSSNSGAPWQLDSRKLRRHVQTHAAASIKFLLEAEKSVRPAGAGGSAAVLVCKGAPPQICFRGLRHFADPQQRGIMTML